MGNNMGSKKKYKKIRKKKRLKVNKIVKIGSPEFAKLQSKWYAILKKDGFNDLEWVDKNTGLGQNSDYLKKPDQMRMKVYNPEKAFHYHLCSNYLAHNTLKDKIKSFIFSRYAEGASFRTITKELNKNRKKKTYSLFWVFYHITRMSKEAIEWNKVHPEGLYNKSQIEAKLIEF